ncbi:MAG: hypothetical protein LBK72_05620 [Bifidobacteriaceae bacterium]|nr:hypothetical protein [Bifidobacteriaceae bacterium]
MKTRPPLLTPFVRSDAVGAILAETFADPESELSIAEVARRTKTLPAVAHKEITRLVDAAILLDRRAGNHRLVRVNVDHPLYGPMAEILAAAYGPVPVLRTLLSDLAGVDRAFIYGSWAARRMGQPGPPPRDVDVMVIGDLGLDDLVAVQESASERLRVEVNVHRCTPEAWAARDDNPFLATVSGRPMVWIVGDSNGTK